MNEGIRELRGTLAIMWFRLRKPKNHLHVYDSAYSFGTDLPRGRDTEFLWCRCGDLKIVRR